MAILRSVLFGVAVHFGIGLAAIAFFLVTFRGGGWLTRTVAGGVGYLLFPVFLLEMCILPMAWIVTAGLLTGFGVGDYLRAALAGAVGFAVTSVAAGLAGLGYWLETAVIQAAPRGWASFVVVIMMAGALAMGALLAASLAAAGAFGRILWARLRAGRKAQAPGG